MKKTLGLILSIVFLIAFLGFLIKIGGLIVVLKSVGIATLIVGAIVLCSWLLTSDN